MAPRSDALKRAEAALAAAALAYPEVHEDAPWGERAFKVAGKKVFLFMSRQTPGHLSLSVKLPVQRLTALALPFAEPTGYGLGVHGWVTSTFKQADRPPVELLLAWLRESYRAVAPARLARTVTGGAPTRPGASVPGTARTRRRPPSAPRATRRGGSRTPRA
jgi:predicted DNA-binding protein (MmcQ/YjbR family)